MVDDVGAGLDPLRRAGKLLMSEFRAQYQSKVRQSQQKGEAPDVEQHRFHVEHHTADPFHQPSQ